MTLTILITLCLIATGCLFVKWRRLGWSVYTLSMIFLVGVGSGLVPAQLLANLQSPDIATSFDAWGKKNVMVVLGVGTIKLPTTGQIEPGIFAYARMLKTLSLYRACKKVSSHCQIMVSGGDARGNGLSEARVYGAYLRELGVQDHDLILEERSMNTWQNAQFTSALLQQRNADRVLLVTSGIHMRRSLLYFSHFGTHAKAIRADYLQAMPSFLPAAYNFTVTDLAVHEYIGVIRYYVYNLLGWNVTATRAGAP